jgi:hypothetical protein
MVGSTLAVITPYQASFQGGELSPKLWGRIDLSTFFDSAARLTNMQALRFGPITKRCGSEFIENKSIVYDTQLLKFIYKSSQAVIIEAVTAMDRTANTYRIDLGFYTYDVNTDKIGRILNADGTEHSMEVTSWWNYWDPPNWRYAQCGDIVYICDGRHKPRKLSRYGWTDWRLEEVTFKTTDENGETVDADPTNEDQVPQEWKDENYPTVVTFYENRLVYAATPDQPQSIWCSRIGQYDDFTKKTTVISGTTTEEDVLDTDAIWYTLASDLENQIIWMVPLDALIVGTSGSEFKISASALNEALTPNNFKAVKQTSYGSLPTEAWPIADGCAFIERSGKKLRLFNHNVLYDTYEAQDTTTFAEHLGQIGFQKFDVMTSKDVYAVCLLNDGSLGFFAYDKTQKIATWSHHILEDAVVHDLCVIPAAGFRDGSDLIMMFVNRIGPDGEWKMSVEFFSPVFGDDAEYNDYTYMDGYVILATGGGVVDHGRLPVGHVRDYFSNRLVDVMIDKYYAGQMYIDSIGNYTLPHAGSDVRIGYKYRGMFASVEINSLQQSTMCRNKRLIAVDLCLVDTYTLRIGVAYQGEKAFCTQAAEEIPFGPAREQQIVDGRIQPRLFTGEKHVLVPGHTDTDLRLLLESRLPYPFTLRNIKYILEVN